MLPHISSAHFPPSPHTYRIPLSGGQHALARCKHNTSNNSAHFSTTLGTLPPLRLVPLCHMFHSSQSSTAVSSLSILFPSLSHQTPLIFLQTPSLFRLPVTSSMWHVQADRGAIPSEVEVFSQMFLSNVFIAFCATHSMPAIALHYLMHAPRVGTEQIRFLQRSLSLNT